MSRYMLRRVPSAIVVLFAASIVIFALLRLVPGNPAAVLAGPDATPAEVARIHGELGLDQSLTAQYVTWLWHMVTLRFGNSYTIGGSVSSLIGAGLANTLVLTITALIVASAIALVVSAGALIADKRWVDGIVTGVSTAAIGVPSFVTGTVFVLIFAVVLSLLPAGGTPPDGFLANIGQSARYLVLPTMCLALPVAAALTRFLTESLHSQMRQPYVTTARALGIPHRRIVLRQALRNALPTSVTVLGIQLGVLLGGAILVEAIFAWPGLGHLLEQAVLNRDYPVIQVLLLLAVVIFVVSQLMTDALNAYLDPRIRLGGVT